jgi:hypothetical protein
MGRLEPHYIAKIEVRPTIGMLEDDEEPGDRDHLLELHEMLERLDDDALAEPEDGSHQSEFLLCEECCRRFRASPLPREFALPLEFSAN